MLMCMRLNLFLLHQVILLTFASSLAVADSQAMEQMPQWQTAALDASKEYGAGRLEQALEGYNRTLVLLEQKISVDAETHIDALLNKATVLLALNRTSEAGLTLTKAQQQISKNGFSNTLIEVRYLRRKVKLDLIRNDSSTALKTQQRLVAVLSSVAGPNCMAVLNERKYLSMVAMAARNWDVVLEVTREFNQINRTASKPSARKLSGDAYRDNTTAFLDSLTRESQTWGERLTFQRLDSFAKTGVSSDVIFNARLKAAQNNSYPALSEQVLIDLNNKIAQLTPEQHASRCKLSSRLMFHYKTKSPTKAFQYADIGLSELSSVKDPKEKDDLRSQIFAIKSVLLTEQGNLAEAEATLDLFGAPLLTQRRISDLGPCFTSRIALAKAYSDRQDGPATKRQIEALRKILQHQKDMPAPALNEGNALIANYAKTFGIR